MRGVLTDSPLLLNFPKIVNLILEERKKQIEKWGVQSYSREKWLCILMEEIGELSEAILKEQEKESIDELVQVIMVGVNILDAMLTENRFTDRVFGVDGNKVYCHRKDFIDLYTSLCGFGDTENDAYEDLVRQEEASVKIMGIA